MCKRIRGRTKFWIRVNRLRITYVSYSFWCCALLLSFELRGRVVNIPASYSGGPAFKYRPVKRHPSGEPAVSSAAHLSSPTSRCLRDCSSDTSRLTTAGLGYTFLCIRVSSHSFVHCPDFHRIPQPLTCPRKAETEARGPLKQSTLADFTSVLIKWNAAG
jgi:hypothetical protein